MGVASSLHFLLGRVPLMGAWILLAMLLGVLVLLVSVAFIGVTTHDLSPGNEIHVLAPFRWPADRALA